jgi:hypothetical protein
MDYIVSPVGSLEQREIRSYVLILQNIKTYHLEVIRVQRPPLETQTIVGLRKLEVIATVRLTA